MDIMGTILIGVCVIVGIAIGILIICFFFCNISTKQSPKIKPNIDVESQRLNPDPQTPDILRIESAKLVSWWEIILLFEKSCILI